MAFITRARQSEIGYVSSSIEEPIGYGRYTAYISGLQPGATGLFTGVVRQQYQIFNCKTFYPTVYLAFHSIPNTGIPLADIYLNPCGTGNTPHSTGTSITPKNYIGTVFSCSSTISNTTQYIETSGRRFIGLDLDNGITTAESGCIRLPKMETTESFGLIMVNRTDLQIATGYISLYKDALVVRYEI